METRTDHNSLYLIPNADLTASNVETLRNKMISYLKSSKEQQVVMDAAGIENIDSLGVNLIIGLYKQVHSTERQFKIINAGDRFLKVAHFFRFPSIFTVQGREENN